MSALSGVHELASQPAPRGRSVLINLAGFLLFPVLVLALTLGSAVVGVVYFENRFLDRIYPGVQAWGVDLTGATVAEAESLLRGAFPYPSQPAFSFRDPGTGRTWTATPGQLGVLFDVAATVGAAYQVGRGGTLWDNLYAQADAYRNGRQFPPFLVIDRNPALVFLERIAMEIYQPVADAGLVFAGDRLGASPFKVGRQMNLADAYSRLLPSLSSLGRGDVVLAIDETQPQITDQQVAGVMEEASRLIGRPITVYLADPTFESDPEPRFLTREQVAAMLVLWLDESSAPPRYRVWLDEAALAAWLEPLGDLLQTEPQDARFVFNDDTGLLEPILNSVPARSLDIPATVQAILAQAFTDNRDVPLVIEWTRPLVNEDATGQELGITELIAVGESSFLGSSDERVHNIATAASRFHGIVIPPGGEFSFNHHLGDVSEETGFEEGLIIFGGRTIRGVGGGVCQVSTTVFRAAFNAGFPIPERWPHGYRVGYYEQDIGVGMDATVFYPEVDLRFVNNSPYHLLVESYTYKTSRKLLFKFYSTGDGRTVEAPEPQMSNVIPHPPDRYEENPELPAGEIKQVDWAADGADVLIERIVRKADESILLQDKFFSHYLPWQAVYQYAPGTEGMPPPEVAQEPGATPAPEPTSTP